MLEYCVLYIYVFYYDIIFIFRFSFIGNSRFDVSSLAFTNLSYRDVALPSQSFFLFNISNLFRVIMEYKLLIFLRADQSHIIIFVRFLLYLKLSCIFEVFIRWSDTMLLNDLYASQFFTLFIHFFRIII